MTELEALRERHSVRNYKDTKIDKDTLFMSSQNSAKRHLKIRPLYV